MESTYTKRYNESLICRSNIDHYSLGRWISEMFDCSRRRHHGESDKTSGLYGDIVGVTGMESSADSFSSRFKLDKGTTRWLCKFTVCAR
jgi:hypothetical protein